MECKIKLISTSFIRERNKTLTSKEWNYYGKYVRNVRSNY